MLLVDILTALSLASAFFVVLVLTTDQAQSIFLEAKAKANLLDLYEAGFSSSTKVVLYGNDRLEKETNLYNGKQSLSFTEITALDKNFPLSSKAVCSADFANMSAAGSYTKETGIFEIKRIDLPIDPSLPLTDFEIRDNRAYVSVDSTNSGDPDLIVFDLKDPNHVQIISAIDTGPGIAAISLQGKRIYAAAASSAAQLHIIRFDSIFSPALEKKYKLALPYATATAPYATAISVSGNLLFLGTEKWDGQEFSIIDISNPANPAKLGGLEIGSKVNGIYVDKNTAYVLASGEGQLNQIEVDNANTPLLGHVFGPSGWQRQEGKAFDIFENYTYFGRTSGGFDINSDHELFQWSSTSPPIYGPADSQNEKGGIYGLVGDRRYLFVIGRQANSELMIFGRNGYALGADFASSTTYTLDILPQKITCYDRDIYILSHSSPNIYKLTWKHE